MGESHDGVVYLSSDEEVVQEGDLSIEVVDLSSDPEDVQEDVSLVLLKRRVGKWELLDVSQTCL